MNRKHCKVERFLSLASVRKSANIRTDAIGIHTFCPVFGTVGTQNGDFLYRRSWFCTFKDGISVVFA